MIIYMITNTINDKVYIGKTVHTIAYRWSQHKNGAKYGSVTHLHKAMRKYGVENFSIQPLINADSDRDLSQLEINLITLCGSKGYGYNLTDGGEGTVGRICSDETRKKMSTARKGRVGQSFSVEARKKMSESHRGMKPTDEARKKMSEAHKLQWKRQRLMKVN
jgi:group I intron endonuclease